MENQNNQQVNQQSESQPKQQNTGKPADVKKLWGILGYIIPILFFIPLVMEDLKTDPYSKFHANQQLNLLLAAIVVNVVGGIIPFLGWFIILPIGSIVLIVLAIIGIVNVAKDKQKPLPIIGGFHLIK